MDNLVYQHSRVAPKGTFPCQKFEENCADRVNVTATVDVMAFAKNTWQDWLLPLVPWLNHLHLHDNCGEGDDHLPVSAGRFDFTGLFSHLRQNNLRPTITLEPHREEDLWKSLQALQQLKLPDPPP